MTNRVHIDAPGGVVEIEGDKDFIERLLSRIFPLIEETGFGSHPPRNPSAFAGEGVASLQDADPEPSGKPKVKKRTVNKAPKGHSCADRILSLKSDGFFKDYRIVSEVVEALKSKGWTHKVNQVSAALNSLFGRNEIQRTKEGNSAWKYYWDRD